VQTPKLAHVQTSEPEPSGELVQPILLFFQLSHQPISSFIILLVQVVTLRLSVMLKWEISRTSTWIQTDGLILVTTSASVILLLSTKVVAGIARELTRLVSTRDRLVSVSLVTSWAFCHQLQLEIQLKLSSSALVTGDVSLPPTDWLDIVKTTQHRALEMHCLMKSEPGQDGRRSLMSAKISKATTFLKNSKINYFFSKKTFVLKISDKLLYLDFIRHSSEGLMWNILLFLNVL
jgi:hypothetical protein